MFAKHAPLEIIDKIEVPDSRRILLMNDALVLVSPLKIETNVVGENKEGTKIIHTYDFGQVHFNALTSNTRVSTSNHGAVLHGRQHRTPKLVDSPLSLEEAIADQVKDFIGEYVPRFRYGFTFDDGKLYVSRSDSARIAMDYVIEEIGWKGSHDQINLCNFSTDNGGFFFRYTEKRRTVIFYCDMEKVQGYSGNVKIPEGFSRKAAGCLFFTGTRMRNGKKFNDGKMMISYSGSFDYDRTYSHVDLTGTKSRAYLLAESNYPKRHMFVESLKAKK